MSDLDCLVPCSLNDSELHTDVISEVSDGLSPSSASMQRGGRRKPPTTREPRSKQQGIWAEVQALRVKLAEQEETIEKLKAAFGMISMALDIQRPAAGVDTLGHTGHTGHSGHSGYTGHAGYTVAASSLAFEEPAHRPPRMSRRGGVNCVNTSHYKTYNRGGRSFHGGYREHVGNSPGFREC